jgi:hypothetical protein
VDPLPRLKWNDTQKYLGFIISSSGNNMDNIKEMRNKSIGIIRKIFMELYF